MLDVQPRAAAFRFLNPPPESHRAFGEFNVKLSTFNFKIATLCALAALRDILPLDRRI